MFGSSQVKDKFLSHFFYIVFNRLTVVLSKKTSILCVRLIINKRSFEPFCVWVFPAILWRTLFARETFYERDSIQTHTRLKERYLLGQNTTSKFSGQSSLSSYKTTLKQQLNGEKRRKKTLGLGISSLMTSHPFFRFRYSPVPLCGQFGINPFTAPACKIFGLKDARTRLQTVYFQSITHLFSLR